MKLKVMYYMYVVLLKMVGSEENENVTREILIKRKVCMVHLLSISLKEALLNSQKWLIKMKRGELFKK